MYYPYLGRAGLFTYRRLYNRFDSKQRQGISVETLQNEHAILDESQKTAVRQQLSRLLANPFFSHSKRFPSFLRFVIEHTLDGDVESIKERTLGIEIFGRDANYDTASDPIVRVTAAEVRKRVAQYYQEPAHRDELRITLPSGSYIPQFEWPNELNEQAAPAADSGGALHPEAHSGAIHAHVRRNFQLKVALACVTGVLLLVGGFELWESANHAAFRFFWQPVLAANEPVLLCIADQLQYSSIALRDAREPGRQTLLKDNLTAVVIDDLNATVKVAGILQSDNKQYSLKGEGATNLADLRAGPTIYIGAFDNAWTLRLTNPLRFHFANDADMTKMRIADSANPTQQSWIVDRSVQMATNNYRDFAIVARFTDTTTGKLSYILAGVGRGGTIAAGEFVTDSVALTELKRAAKAAGDKKNMEVVLSTQIIDGEPGSPKMEATYFW
jgi:hypothetical protein